MTGYSSRGLIIVVYSFSFVSMEQFVKRFMRVSVCFALPVLYFMCLDMPLGVTVKPSSMPSLVYGTCVLCSCSGGGLCLAMGMSVNFCVFVLIFHWCS